MSTERDAILARLRKIKALKDGSSHKGERDAATRVLERALKESNISEAELEGETLAVFHASVPSKLVRKLFFQCCARALGRELKDKTDFYWTNSTKVRLRFTLPVSKGVELTALFAVMRKAYESAQEDFFSAFILRNELWADDPPAKERELSREERERIERARELARGIKRTDVHKQIERQR